MGTNNQINCVKSCSNYVENDSTCANTCKSGYFEVINEVKTCMYTANCDFGFYKVKSGVLVKCVSKCDNLVDD